MTKEIIYNERPEVIEAIKNQGFNDVYETAISVHGREGEKFMVYWPIPDTDEQAKERYNCSLGDLIRAGVAKLSTTPDYAGRRQPNAKDLKEGLTGEYVYTGAAYATTSGDLRDDFYEAMQAAADGYAVGRSRTAGPSQKAKAAKLDALTERTGGMSPDEIAAFVAKAKAAGIEL